MAPSVEAQVEALTATLAWAWGDVLDGQPLILPSKLKKVAEFLVECGIRIDTGVTSGRVAYAD